MTDLKTLRNSGISRSDVASISSLTPSVMHSPNKDKTFSPTGTPLNSPIGIIFFKEKKTFQIEKIQCNLKK